MLFASACALPAPIFACPGYGMTSRDWPGAKKVCVQKGELLRFGKEPSIKSSKTGRCGVMSNIIEQ